MLSISTTSLKFCCLVKSHVALDDVSFTEFNHRLAERTEKDQNMYVQADLALNPPKTNSMVTNDRIKK